MAARSHNSRLSSSSSHLCGKPESTSARRLGRNDMPSAEHLACRVQFKPRRETASLSEVAAPANGLLAEGLITLTEATRYCPRRRGGRKVHTSTIYRWATRGSRGVWLEVVDTPSGLCTSVPALQRFFDRLTSNRDLPHQRPQPRCSDKRQEAIEAELQRRFRI